MDLGTIQCTHSHMHAHMLPGAHVASYDMCPLSCDHCPSHVCCHGTFALLACSHVTFARLMSVGHVTSLYLT